MGIHLAELHESGRGSIRSVCSWTKMDNAESVRDTRNWRKTWLVIIFVVVLSEVLVGAVTAVEAVRFVRLAALLEIAL